MNQEVGREQNVGPSASLSLQFSSKMDVERTRFEGQVQRRVKRGLFACLKLHKSHDSGPQFKVGKGSYLVSLPKPSTLLLGFVDKENYQRPVNSLSVTFYLKGKGLFCEIRKRSKEKLKVEC